MRRALDQLTAKRLIAHIPNRGYHVYAMDPDVHGQIRDIRILLETGAAADLMPNVTSAKVRALRALAERFAKLLQDGTLLEQYEVNLAFHAALYDLCSNRELVALIQETRAPAAARRIGEHFDGRALEGARAIKARHGGHFLSAAANRGFIPDPAGCPAGPRRPSGNGSPPRRFPALRFSPPAAALQGYSRWRRDSISIMCIKFWRQNA